jgi:hypothetical protein
VFFSGFWWVFGDFEVFLVILGGGLALFSYEKCMFPAIFRSKLQKHPFL